MSARLPADQRDPVWTSSLVGPGCATTTYAATLVRSDLFPRRDHRMANAPRAMADNAANRSAATFAPVKARVPCGGDAVVAKVPVDPPAPGDAPVAPVTPDPTGVAPAAPTAPAAPGVPLAVGVVGVPPPPAGVPGVVGPGVVGPGVVGPGVVGPGVVGTVVVVVGVGAAATKLLVKVVVQVTVLPPPLAEPLH